MTHQFIYTVEDNKAKGEEGPDFIMRRRKPNSKHSMVWGMSLQDLKQLAAVIDEKLTTEEAIRCKHCDVPVQVHDNGYVVHLGPGGYTAKVRCDPDLTGLVYGYNADPIGQPCNSMCLGAVNG